MRRKRKRIEPPAWSSRANTRTGREGQMRGRGKLHTGKRTKENEKRKQKKRDKEEEEGKEEKKLVLLLRPL